MAELEMATVAVASPAPGTSRASGKAPVARAAERPAEAAAYLKRAAAAFAGAGGDGGLPFTGFAPAVAGGIGAAFVAVGSLLRRAVSRRGV